MELNSEELFNRFMNYSVGNSKGEEKKKMRPSEKLLENIKNNGFDMTQLESVLKVKGNQLIISSAGSGKTTSLVFKVIYDLKTGRATKVVDVNGNNIRVPETIWVATFLKTGAEELGASLRKWQYKLNCVDASQSIRFSTLHAEFKRALTQMGITTDIIDDSTNTNLLKAVVKTYELRNSNGNNLNAEDIRDLSGALTYTRNRLDDSRYENQIYEDLNIGASIIDAILRDWKVARQTKNLMDFEDLQEMLYEECYVRKNEKIIDFLANRYKFIYIDEFQDTSQIQYALIKIYARDTKQVVAIGDDDQTIYSWRGSDNKIITEKFKEDFDPTISELSVNYRCPSNILDAIKPSIEMNTHRFKKELRSYRKGGTVYYGAYSGYRGMVQSLCDMINDDVSSGLSVAVLCRVNSDGLMPAMLLDKFGKFSFSISGDGMTLDSYIGKLVISIVKLFTERATPAVRKALDVTTWDTYCVNNLMKICKANKLSIWNIDSKDLEYSCPSISEMILEWRGWRESVGDLKALKLVLQYYRTRVFVKESQFNDVVRSVIITIEALLDYFEYDSVEDFLLEIEDINERLKARKKNTKAQVKIATVHEFKGKEADSVYIWNDTEGVFPYRGSELITEELEEERRIHYIACTRAKVKSTVMYLKNKQGLFVGEMDFSNAIEIQGITSGTVGSDINGKLQKESALQKFEKSATEPEKEMKYKQEDMFDNPDFIIGVEDTIIPDKPKNDF